MEFPNVSNRLQWMVLKDKEPYWASLESGEEKLAGLITAYWKIGKQDSPQEYVSEINLFNRGAVVQLWVRNAGTKQQTTQARMLKNGQWLLGLPNARVQMEPAYENEKFIGFRLLLKMPSGGKESLIIYQDSKRGR